MEWLGFYPRDIANGELWRIVTGQILHTNFNHAVLNALGLLLVWALHGEYYDSKHYATVVITSLILVGVPLAIFYNTTHYAGLSGIIHALIIYGAIIDVNKQVKTGWLILVGILAKVGYENLVGASQETAELIDAKVAVEAHLFGALAGILMGAIYLLIKKRSDYI